jgi:hypothetical protein
MNSLFENNYNYDYDQHTYMIVDLYIDTMYEFLSVIDIHLKDMILDRIFLKRSYF